MRLLDLLVWCLWCWRWCSFLQVSSNSVHWEPLHHPAAEEDCPVPERDLRGQVRCGRRPDRRLQNTAQSKQPEGQDTHQSRNQPVDLTVGLNAYVSVLPKQEEYLVQNISLEWMQPVNNHKMMREWRMWKEIIITSFEFVLVQLLNGYENVEKLLKVSPVPFLLLTSLFVHNYETILQFYDDVFKINKLNSFIGHSLKYQTWYFIVLCVLFAGQTDSRLSKMVDLEQLKPSINDFFMHQVPLWQL